MNGFMNSRVHEMSERMNQRMNECTSNGISPLDADESPAAVYSVPGTRRNSIIMHEHICPCVSPETLVCGIGVKFDFKPAEIVYNVPHPVPRGPFIAAEAMKSDRPLHVQVYVSDVVVIGDILEVEHMNRHI